MKTCGYYATYVARIFWALPVLLALGTQAAFAQTAASGALVTSATGSLTRIAPEGGRGVEPFARLRDYHWGELFKAAALSTLLSIGAESGSSNGESDIVRALRNGASNSISQTGQQIVQRQLNIAPTLTIRPGFPVRVIVTRDLVLEPYGG